MRTRKNKDGWYRWGAKRRVGTSYFINDELPNILCKKMNVPGVLYPWGIVSGTFNNDKTEFTHDYKIDLHGIAAWNYYKDKAAIKKLIAKKQNDRS
tara:strand:+ start:310 stop:597 length:288 start_codon:yes stop_codon:yes gene_type:complete